MDEFDEYNLDLDLDDEALNALQQAEQEYALTQVQSVEDLPFYLVSQAAERPPPTKPAKPTRTNLVGPSTKFTLNPPSPQDDDPEVMVMPDGTYQLSFTQRQQQQSNIPQTNARDNRIGSQRHPIIPPSSQHAEVASSSSPVVRDASQLPPGHLFPRQTQAVPKLSRASSFQQPQDVEDAMDIDSFQPAKLPPMDPHAAGPHRGAVEHSSQVEAELNVLKAKLAEVCYA